jgi:hypothetical protein
MKPDAIFMQPDAILMEPDDILTDWDAILMNYFCPEQLFANCYDIMTDFPERENDFYPICPIGCRLLRLLFVQPSFWKSPGRLQFPFHQLPAAL